MKPAMARFSETLLEHARHPHNFGRDSSATAFGQADLNGQPPRVEVYLQITEGVIKHASYYAEGCGVTIAIGSVMTDLLREQTLRNAWEISADKVMKVLEGVPADKVFCIDVSLSALRSALAKISSM